MRNLSSFSGTTCDAKRTLNDHGNLITIPLVKVRIDTKIQELTSGDPIPPLYFISIAEEIYIKFATGDVQKLENLQIREIYIKFSSA
jgi:hypothetical protein